MKSGKGKTYNWCPHRQLWENRQVLGICISWTNCLQKCSAFHKNKKIYLIASWWWSPLWAQIQCFCGRLDRSLISLNFRQQCRWSWMPTPIGRIGGYKREKIHQHEKLFYQRFGPWSRRKGFQPGKFPSGKPESILMGAKKYMVYIMIKLTPLS